MASNQDKNREQSTQQQGNYQDKSTGTTDTDAANSRTANQLTDKERNERFPVDEKSDEGRSRR